MMLIVKPGARASRSSPRALEPSTRDSELDGGVASLPPAWTAPSSPLRRDSKTRRLEDSKTRRLGANGKHLTRKHKLKTQDAAEDWKEEGGRRLVLDAQDARDWTQGLRTWQLRCTQLLPSTSN